MSVATPTAGRARAVTPRTARRGWPRGRLPRRILGGIGTYVGALLLAVFALAPIAWMVLTSVKPQAEIISSTPVFVPSRLVIERY
ncbi:MAG: hypothetical protein ACRDJ9_35660, partial [Dehalococcoidia bacterium]